MIHAQANPITSQSLFGKAATLGGPRTLPASARTNVTQMRTNTCAAATRAFPSGTTSAR